MSENKLDLNAKVDVPEQLVDAVASPVKSLLNPIAKSIGEGLGGMIDYIFSPFNYMSEKRELQYDYKLKLLKIELDSKINEIPEDKLCEPDLQTVGTALENSKFCIESDELRAMFVNLISNSANIDNKSKVHPSFASMIKEMKPLEAEILTLFKAEATLPIVEYHINLDNNGYTVLQTNVLLYKPKHNIDDVDQIASSLSNLNRLGLIEISYIEHITTEERYAKYDEFLNTMKVSSLLNKTLSNNYSLQKGVAKITPLGKAFISVCISD